MKKLLALATILCAEAGAQSTLPPVIDSLILQGTHAALLHDYGRAERFFIEAATADRTHPAGPIFLAGLQYHAAEDLSILFDHHAFDSLLTEAEVRAQGRRPLSENDPWIPLLRATAHGMLAVEESESGDWMAAVRDALSSSSEARDAQRRDSSLADAGLPLGNYLYWKSRKTEALHWLPMFNDERGEGIRLLEECAQRGRYHRFAAITSLVWILHDAKELGEAETWARKGLASYPQNRTFLAGLAMVLESRGAYAEAADAWARISASLEASGCGERYSVFSASTNRLRCVFASGDTLRSRGLAIRISSPELSQVPERLHRRYKAKSAELDELKKKCLVPSAPVGSLQNRP